jgi:hypothetical protein
MNNESHAPAVVVDALVTASISGKRVGIGNVASVGRLVAYHPHVML